MTRSKPHDGLVDEITVPSDTGSPTIATVIVGENGAVCDFQLARGGVTVAGWMDESTTERVRDALDRALERMRSQRRVNAGDESE